MSLIDVARDSLKDIPMAEVLRERLSLALDQSAVLEKQVAQLQIKVGSLEAQLERERTDLKQAREKLQLLQEENAEEIRFYKAIEFRRSKRTGNKWMPFCTACHRPAVVEASENDYVFCAACPWVSYVPVNEAERAVSEFTNT